jgi:hypothetical protein
MIAASTDCISAHKSKVDVGANLQRLQVPDTRSANRDCIQNPSPRQRVVDHGGVLFDDGGQDAGGARRPLDRSQSAHYVRYLFLSQQHGAGAPGK